MSRVPAEQRREQLIEATIDLAIEEGLAAASVRRIAERANVSLGVVHYCFSSKEALINAVAEAFIEPVVGPVSEAIAAVGDADIATKGRAAFQAFWTSTQSHPGRQLLSYELASWSIRGDGEAARLLYATYLDIIEGFLTEGMGIEGTEQMSTRTLARMVLTVTDGAMLAWLVDRDADATSDVIEGYLGVLLTVIDQGLRGGTLRRREDPPSSAVPAAV